MQADDVRAVTDPDTTELELAPRERDMLRAAAGKVMLLYLRGAMIFGTSRVISRKNSEVEERRVLIVDLTDVVHLGVSSALTIEEAVMDMIEAGRAVYIVAVPGQPRQRLENMGVLQRLPVQNVVDTRLTALEHAVVGVTTSEPALTPST